MVEGRGDTPQFHYMELKVSQKSQASPKAPPETLAVVAGDVGYVRVGVAGNRSAPPEASALASDATEAYIEADIRRLLEGFDARLNAVNQRLDHVLERATAS